MIEKSKNNHEKIVGYVLLALGAALILFSVIEMFVVYYGNTAPPALVAMSDVSLPNPVGSNFTLASGLEISQILNLSFWYVLMFFILAAGGKIATLGVGMVKDIKVEVRESLQTPRDVKVIDSKK
jgi:hypothetical protein